MLGGNHERGKETLGLLFVMQRDELFLFPTKEAYILYKLTHFIFYNYFIFVYEWISKELCAFYAKMSINKQFQ